MYYSRFRFASQRQVPGIASGTEFGYEYEFDIFQPSGRPEERYIRSRIPVRELLEGVIASQPGYISGTWDEEYEGFPSWW